MEFIWISFIHLTINDSSCTFSHVQIHAAMMSYCPRHIHSECENEFIHSFTQNVHCIFWHFSVVTFFFFVRLFAEEAATWQSYRPATKAKIYWIFIVVCPLFGLMFPFISHIATVTFYCVRSKNQVKLQWVRLSSPVCVSFCAEVSALKWQDFQSSFSHKLIWSFLFQHCQKHFPCCAFISKCALWSL